MNAVVMPQPQTLKYGWEFPMIALSIKTKIFYSIEWRVDFAASQSIEFFKWWKTEEAKVQEMEGLLGFDLRSAHMWLQRLQA